MKRGWIVFLTMVLGNNLPAQWVAGPMLGPVELREAGVWVATRPGTKQVVMQLTPAGAEGKARTALPDEVFTRYDFQTCSFRMGGLEPGTAYRYTITVTGGDGKSESRTGNFTTKTLFQFRMAAPDFRFLAGSCSYFNEPLYDRPGKPYGQDSSIFEQMATEKAAFMLWLGDNWYTREVDYQSKWGLWYRAIHDRSQPVLQPFLKSMGHIAIWDDHDYGPNDYGKSYPFKSVSREVFSKMWLNPGFGEGNEGIYTRYQYNDVDFFLLDDRWWRDFDRLPDSLNGKPNPNKRMLGAVQMEWLKNELLYSKSNPFIQFRIIVCGSQVLNPGSPFDNLRKFPTEYYELIAFLKEAQIEGVVFLSGDRHHSEIIKVQEPGMYPLFDITSSPLSSGSHTFSKLEANNPWRVAGVDKLQNYARIAITGSKENRKLMVEFVGLKGEQLAQWEIGAAALTFKQ